MKKKGANIRVLLFIGIGDAILIIQRRRRRICCSSSISGGGGESNELLAHRSLKYLCIYISIFLSIFFPTSQPSLALPPSNATILHAPLASDAHTH